MAYERSPAVERAIEFARKLPHGESDYGYLCGLLSEEEGVATTMLGRAGLDYAGWAADHPSAIPPDELAAPNDLDALLRRTTQQVRRMGGEATITSDAFLFAIVAGDARMRSLLARYGFRIEKFTAQFDEAEPIEIPDQAAIEPLVMTEQTSLARLLDANANRAMESLRTIDDYCRFVLDDATLTESWKRLRHDLAEGLDFIPRESRDQSRDTPGDVGTAISAAGEYERGDAGDVVRRNIKRLQESLRSLEEYGKTIDPRLARSVEAVRYRVYALEPVTAAGGAVRERLRDVRLYLLLTTGQTPAALDWTLSEAVAEDVVLVQLREKNVDDRTLLQRAKRMREWTRRERILYVVNDRVDIAALADADGVHLGQGDLSVAAARRILGPGKLVGVSTHTVEQVRQAVADGADYIGVGPTFTSRTKQFHSLSGLDFVRAAHAATSLPIFVIGGVDSKNVAEVMAAGGSRVAVSASVAQADDPRTAAAALAGMLTQ